MPVTKASALDDIRVLPSGIFLDEISGGGGLPMGRICEFWGAKDTGKTSAALQVIAAAQQKGYKCLYVDVEFAFWPEYAQKLGVDTTALDVLREGTAEEFIDTTEAAIKKGAYDVIVFDSIGDLSSRLSQEKNAGEKTIGTQASLMTVFSRHIAPYVVLNKILFIGINHERIDFMGMGKVYQMGGKKWSEKVKFSVRFREKPGMVVKVGDKQIGRVIVAKVDKNHIWGTKGKEMDVQLLNDEGFSQTANLAEVAKAAQIITRVGNTFFFNEEKIGTNAKLMDWIKIPENEERIKAAIG